MFASREIRLGAFLALALLLPSVSNAADSWTCVPSDGATDVAQPVSVSAALDTGGGGSVMSMTYSVTVVNGYSGSTNTNITTNAGNGQATFGGTITFNPALATGRQVQVTYNVITSDFVTHSESVTFTVK